MTAVLYIPYTIISLDRMVLYKILLSQVLLLPLLLLNSYYSITTMNGKKHSPEPRMLFSTLWVHTGCNRVTKCHSSDCTCTTRMGQGAAHVMYDISTYINDTDIKLHILRA